MGVASHGIAWHRMAMAWHGRAWERLLCGAILFVRVCMYVCMYVCVGGQVKSGQVVFKDPEFDRVENGTVDCR